jgi:transcriptional regulator with XRE-family HTH domain
MYHPTQKKEVVHLKHRLHWVRKAKNMSVKVLAEKTNLAVSTIYKIENISSPFKTHIEVAELIAEALECKPSDIFYKEELSRVGRPPLTGGKVTVTMITTIEQKFCGIHFIELPTCGTCGFCQE